MSAEIDYVAAGRKIGRASRIAQGLPPVIEDAATLARIAALLTAPHDLHTRRIKAVRAAIGSGSNNDAVNKGPGDLAGPTEPTLAPCALDALSGLEQGSGADTGVSGDSALERPDLVVDGPGSGQELAA